MFHTSQTLHQPLTLALWRRYYFCSIQLFHFMEFREVKELWQSRVLILLVSGTGIPEHRFFWAIWRAWGCLHQAIPTFVSWMTCTWFHLATPIPWPSSYIWRNRKKGKSLIIQNQIPWDRTQPQWMLGSIPCELPEHREQDFRIIIY